MDYGKRFKYYRNRAKLTQKEAAALIGINDYQLGNYETNRSEPSLAILKKMSRLYRVSIDKMLGNKPFPVDGDLIKIEDDEENNFDNVLNKIKEYVEELEKSRMK